MKFTDDKLQKLEERLQADRMSFAGTEFISDEIDDLEALIHRMKLAENALWSRMYGDSVMEQSADYVAWELASGSKMRPDGHPHKINRMGAEIK